MINIHTYKECCARATSYGQYRRTEVPAVELHYTAAAVPAITVTVAAKWHPQSFTDTVNKYEKYDSTCPVSYCEIVDYL